MSGPAAINQVGVARSVQDYTKEISKMISKNNFEKINTMPEMCSSMIFGKVPLPIYLLQTKNIDAFKKIHWTQDSLRMRFKGNNVLHIATEAGELEFVHAILQQAPNLVDSRNEKDISPIHIAARNGWLEGLTVFAHVSRSSLNNPGAGFFPIHFAAFNQKMGIVDFLNDNGVNPFARDIDKKLAIDYISDEGDKKKLRTYMVEYRVNQCGQLNQETKKFIQENLDFVIEMGAEKFQIHDFNQLVCIKNEDVVKKLLAHDTKEQVSPEQYKEFLEKYPVIDLDPRDPFDEQIKQNKRALAGLEEREKEAKARKNDKDEDKDKDKKSKKHKKGKHNEKDMDDDVEIDVEESRMYEDEENEKMNELDQIKMMKEQLKRKNKELEQAKEQAKIEKEKEKQEQIDEFMRNPTWVNAYAKRCPLLYRAVYKGKQLLHYAVLENRKDILQILFENNCNAFAVDENGNNILHLIAKNHLNDFIPLLCDSFVNKETHIIQELCRKENNEKQTPYITAIVYNNTDLINILDDLRIRQDISRNRNSKNICHYATIYNAIGVLSKAARDGDYDCEDEYGMCPIDYAIQNTNYKAFLILYPHVRRPERLFYVSVKLGKTEFIKFLLSKELSPVDYKDHFGMTALHIAAYKQKNEFIELFKEFINSEVRDINNKKVSDIINSQSKPAEVKTQSHKPAVEKITAPTQPTAAASTKPGKKHGSKGK